MNNITQIVFMFITVFSIILILAGTIIYYSHTSNKKKNKKVYYVLISSIDDKLNQPNIFSNHRVAYNQMRQEVSKLEKDIKKHNQYIYEMHNGSEATKIKSAKYYQWEIKQCYIDEPYKIPIPSKDLDY